jgi:HEAT repeat protein
MRQLFLMLGLVTLLVGCGKTPPTLADGKPVSHWLQALDDTDAQVRIKAIQALGSVGPADPAVIPALIGAVNDPDTAVRVEAIVALLKIGPAAKAAIPVLKEAREDKDKQVRSYAVKALAKIGGE